MDKLTPVTPPKAYASPSTTPVKGGGPDRAVNMVAQETLTNISPPPLVQNRILTEKSNCSRRLFSDDVVEEPQTVINDITLPDQVVDEPQPSTTSRSTWSYLEAREETLKLHRKEKTSGRKRRCKGRKGVYDLSLRTKSFACTPPKKQKTENGTDGSPYRNVAVVNYSPSVDKANSELKDGKIKSAIYKLTPEGEPNGPSYIGQTSRDVVTRTGEEFAAGVGLRPNGAGQVWTMGIRQSEVVWHASVIRTVPLGENPHVAETEEILKCHLEGTKLFNQVLYQCQDGESIRINDFQAMGSDGLAQRMQEDAHKAKLKPAITKFTHYHSSNQAPAVDGQDKLTKCEDVSKWYQPRSRK
jgi:hypothetical protein